MSRETQQHYHHMFFPILQLVHNSPFLSVKCGYWKICCTVLITVHEWHPHCHQLVGPVAPTDREAWRPVFVVRLPVSSLNINGAVGKTEVVANTGGRVCVGHGDFSNVVA